MKTVVQATLLFVFGITLLHAQTKPCKTKVKENKNKALVYDWLQLLRTSWTIQDMRFTETPDSVTIQSNGARLATIHIKNNVITDKTFSEFYPDGKLRRFDSLTRFSWHENLYYQNYSAQTVYSRQYYPSGIAKNAVYYRRSGEDSLMQDWYPSGTLRKTVWFNRWANDSVTYTWNSRGILQRIETGSTTKEFDDNGLLKYSKADTGMMNRSVVCIRTYYPSGILRSVEYYFRGMECGNWSYYNEQGTLSKTLKKPAVNTLPMLDPENRVVMAEERPVYTFVEVMPEFPGGDLNLKKYLNEKLSGVACQTKMPLQGYYIIEFEVSTEGQVSFQSLFGDNSDGIQDAIKAIVNQMPRWKPGKRSGRNVDVTFALVLKLE